MKIVLASQSPYRKKQLKDFGLKFLSLPPQFNEETFKKKQMTPTELAKALALGKAKSLADRFPQDIVIGADQLVSLDQQIFGKPGNLTKAKKQLDHLSGRTHQLITSLCVVQKNRTYSRTVVAHITLRKLKTSEIVSYLNKDRPFDCAGSYKFEKAGFSLVDRIKVSDPSALIGLPLIELGKILRKIGALP